MRARVEIWTNSGEALESMNPADRFMIGEWIRVYAGPADGSGAESFELLVCTPAWLAVEVVRTGPMVGRHLLIVEKWDATQVRDKITELFTQENGKDWHDLAVRLSRLGFWEFEDFQAWQGH